MRQKHQTRGRTSAGDKVFPSTSGNFEVNIETVTEIAVNLGISLDRETTKELLAQINWRIGETRNQYLTWREAEKSVVRLVTLAKQTIDAIGEVSNLGENDIGRPQGLDLLHSIDFDFESRVPHHRTDSIDVTEWLRFLAKNIENEFVLLGGRADPYREFILVCRDIMDNANALPHTAPKRVLTDFLVALDEKFDGLVFPPDTTKSSRYDYVRNAIRS